MKCCSFLRTLNLKFPCCQAFHIPQQNAKVGPIEPLWTFWRLFFYSPLATNSLLYYTFPILEFSLVFSCLSNSFVFQFVFMVLCVFSQFFVAPDAVSSTFLPHTYPFPPLQKHSCFTGLLQKQLLFYILPRLKAEKTWTHSCKGCKNFNSALKRVFYWKSFECYVTLLKSFAD